MSRFTGAEIKDAVDEIKPAFDTLHERIRSTQSVVYNRKDYTAALNPLILKQHRVNVGPFMLRLWKDLVVSKLMGYEYAIHMEPTGGRKRDDTDADLMELYRGWLWLQLNPNNYVRRVIASEQATGYFAAFWLEAEKWADPKQDRGESNSDYAERAERAKRNWQPFRLRNKPADSVAFLENEGVKTAAIAEYELPVSEFFARYEGVDRNDRVKQRQLLDGEYKWIRDEARSQQARNKDSFRNAVKICMYADMERICQYVETHERGKVKYREAGEGEWENCFGIVPLLTAEGNYNPNVPIELRRESILQSLIDIEDAQAYMNTNMASKAFAMPWYQNKLPSDFASLPPDTQQRLMQVGFQTDPKTGLPLISNTYGGIEQIETSLNADFTALLEQLAAGRQSAAPVWGVNSGETRASVPASRDVMAKEEFQDRLNWAQTSTANFMQQAFEGCENYIRTKLNEHRSKGDGKRPSDWLLDFQPSNDARKYGDEVERGKVYVLTPQALDNDYVCSITAKDNRISTKLQTLQLINALEQANALLPEEKLEMIGIEHGTQWIRRWNAVQGFRTMEPAQDMAVKADAVAWKAAHDGLGPEEVQQLQAMVAGLPGYVPPASPNGGVPGLSTVTVGSPITNDSQAGSESTA